MTDSSLKSCLFQSIQNADAGRRGVANVPDFEIRINVKHGITASTIHGQENCHVVRMRELRIRRNRRKEPLQTLDVS